MAYETLLTNPFSLPAAGDLSANQYRFMVATGGNATLSGVGAASVGVLQNDPSAAGQPAAILAVGISKVVAGAAVTAGAKVQSDSTGRAIAATSTAFVTGVAVTAAAAAGEIISVLVLPLGHFALV